MSQRLPLPGARATSPPLPLLGLAAGSAGRSLDVLGVTLVLDSFEVGVVGWAGALEPQLVSPTRMNQEIDRDITADNTTALTREDSCPRCGSHAQAPAATFTV